MSNEDTINLCNHCTLTERCYMRKRNPSAKVLDCARYKPTEEFAKMVKDVVGVMLSEKLKK